MEVGLVLLESLEEKSLEGPGVKVSRWSSGEEAVAVGDGGG